ncbi:type I-MYXAN CRISPR-associated protein Cas6/Cmx6 [Nostoc sp. C117]|uniref:type I-MYXAN CRISPR-associated protein Cas6/Cmx6 n=1 Tax=Nostoc sp. C117 TaxID=3349875 RepID=UPI00370D17F1
MSEIHLRQIKSYLQKTFNGLIDLSDYQNKSETDRELVFLTRSLAAFTLMVLANISPQEASKSIVDGGQDNGIDSLYFDRREKIMYVLQSKWKQDSKGSVKTDEVMKFTDLIFTLIAETVPFYHGHELFSAIAHFEPELHKLITVVIHTIAGIRREGVIQLTKNSRLRIRLPLDQVPLVYPFNR